MKMDSESYWAKRAEEREAFWYKKCHDTIEKELAQYYSDSLDHIQDSIAALYGRFAKDNKLSVTDAQKLITGSEYRKWRMSIESYIKKIKQTHDAGLLKELNTLAMRSRISRLDKLYGETVEELDKLGRNVSKSMASFLSDAYKDNYYHGLYDIAKAGKLINAVAKVDDKALEDVLRTRWSGKNYSERIWKNEQLLGQTLKQEMFNAVHRGESIQKISTRIAKKMDTGIYNARRLVRTELNYVDNNAAFSSIIDSGMKYFRFIATLDKRTSSICRSHDGKVYSIDDANTGSNIPPLHPNCRSTIVGSLYGPDKEKTGTRAARNTKGKTIFVPADMSYDEWKAIYVDEAKNQGKKNDLLKAGADNGTISTRSERSLEQAKKRDYKIFVTDVAIDKVPYVAIPGFTKEQNEYLQEEHKNILRIAKDENNSNEVLSIASQNTLKSIRIMGDEFSVNPSKNEDAQSAFMFAKRKELMYLHNHPSTNTFSLIDIAEFIKYGQIGLLSVITNQGKLYVLHKSNTYLYNVVRDIFTELYTKYQNGMLDYRTVVKKFLKKCYEGGLYYEKSN